MRFTLSQLNKRVAEGDRLVMVSCYDATSGAVCDAAGAELLLVGDSLGMVVQGHDSTLPVTIDHMVYHTQAVSRGAPRSLVIGDLPFGAYQRGPEQAFDSAVKLMAAGAQMVKLEGGAVMAETVEFLSTRGIPVCGHVGLTPQSVHALGGFKVQGRDDEAARRLLDDSKRLEAAGMAMIVLEAIPAPLGKQITEALTIPTLGIGAGPHCDGQILILHDLIDMYPGKKAKFVKNFMTGAGSIAGALEAFVREVKAGTFPGPEHCY